MVLSQIKISPIVSISEDEVKIAPKYKEKTGNKFIHFQRGEIDLPTFDEIKEEVKKALDENKTKYPISGGDGSLKLALIEKLERYNKIKDLSLDNVVVTAGGQEALNIAFELFTEKNGKRVKPKAAAFTPVWSLVLDNFVPYSDIQLREVILNEDFSVNFKNLEKILSHGLDFFYLNNPCNPTGKVFSEEELIKIGEMCKRKKVSIITDEAYEYFVYDDKKHTSVASLPELKNNSIISTFSFSKTYSMTGFRAGYVFTKDKNIAKKMKEIQYTHTGGIPSFIQPALITALKLEDKVIKRVKIFKERRDYLYEDLNEIDGLNIQKPDGAFYLFPDFSKLVPKKYKGDNLYIYNKLLKEGISTIPGCYFTRNDNFKHNIRLSFSSTNLDMIGEGVRRIKKIFS